MGTFPDKMTVGQIDARAAHNMIWQNASASYRNAIPKLGDNDAWVKVGESLATNMGYAHEWVYGLQMEIGKKILQSGFYRNQFEVLSKGYVPYGKKKESIYVELAELRDFSLDKGPWRELERNPAKIQTQFFVTNFEGQYAVTLPWHQLKGYFTTEQGVVDLVEHIRSSIVNAFNSDDRDMYLYTFLIQVLGQNMKEIVIPWDAADLSASTRGLTKTLQATATRFANMRNDYNSRGVDTVTNPDELSIIMDADTWSEYKVELRSSSFHSNEVDLTGRIIVIDDWDSINEKRFDVLRAKTGQLRKFTDLELAYLKSGAIKALMFDSMAPMVFTDDDFWGETKINGTGETNLFYNVFKTYGWSDVNNAVCITTTPYKPAAATLTFKVTQKTVNDAYTGLALEIQGDNRPNFRLDADDPDNVAALIAVLESGGIYAPTGATVVKLALESNGKQYTAPDLDLEVVEVDTVITFTEV